MKNEESSMFPKNWDIKRIQEEVAYVYENTVAKDKDALTKLPMEKFRKYQTECTKGFDIRIEVNNTGNIMNAYPILIK